ncbi:MAG: hypothetical protein WC748_05130 [Legionellales bacterium]|jgi:hypothetical protein
MMLQDNVLITAVESDNVALVKQLVVTHPDLMAEAGQHGDTALHCVAWNGIEVANSCSDKIFNILLTAAIQSKTAESLLNIQNVVGDTPLTRALGKSKTIDDIFAKRAVSMIQCGAILPDTRQAKRVFEKLPLASQQFIQEKLDAYQKKITLAVQPSETQTSSHYNEGTLLQYTEGQSSSTVSASSSVRHRSTAHTNDDKSKAYELSAF